MMRTQAAEVSTTIDAPAEAVWSALTTPALLKQYFFGADVESTWKPGDPITFSGEFKGKGYVDRGEIVTARANEELAFTHWSELSGDPNTPENHHLITIGIEYVSPERTTVTLRQENNDGADVDSTTRANLEKNWQALLDGLKKTVESEAARR